MSDWSIVSDVCGWLYVVSWGLSTYPQIYLNFKLKSVEGFKLDYPFLNISGFTFYSLSYSFAYFYADFPYDNYGLGKIRIQDLIFAYHNLCTSIILNLQALFYKKGANRVSVFSIWFTLILWLSGLFIFVATQLTQWIPISEGFNILVYLGYLKISVTLTKYAPLVYWNFTRKTTKGFSIIFILFDLGGGSLSVAQLLIDYHEKFTSTLNPIKLGLGCICVFYDLTLIYQHYVLYGRKKANNQVSDTDVYVKVVDEKALSRLGSIERSELLSGDYCGSLRKLSVDNKTYSKTSN